MTLQTALLEVSYETDCYHLCGRSQRYLSLHSVSHRHHGLSFIIAFVVRVLFVVVSLVVNDYINVVTFVMVAFTATIVVFALFVIDLVTFIVIADKSISRGIGLPHCFTVICLGCKTCNFH